MKKDSHVKLICIFYLFIYFILKNMYILKNILGKQIKFLCMKWIFVTFKVFLGFFLDQYIYVCQDSYFNWPKFTIANK